MTNPYAERALDLFDHGFAPIHVPIGKKMPPEKGRTGSAGRDATRAEIAATLEAPSNVGIRLAPDQVAIDVDHYGDKRGADSLAALEAELGPLPATWSVTARGNENGPGLSRQMLFRVPAGTYAVAPAPDIDTIQHRHRYCMAPGSIHPDGTLYRAYDPSGAEIDGLPHADELPYLPTAWVEYLWREGGVDAAPGASSAEVEAFRLGTRCMVPSASSHKGFQKMLNRPPRGSRHDHLVAYACQAMREVRAGLYWFEMAEQDLEQWWRNQDVGPARAIECRLAIRWAVAQANALSDAEIAEIRSRAKPTTSERTKLGGTPPPEPSPATDDVLAPSHLPDAFFDEREALRAISQAARSSLVSRDAVLAAVLARIAACMSHRVRLPGIVGGKRVGLTYYSAIIGAPGTGKSQAVGVARRLVHPSPAVAGKGLADDLPIGSGEGMIEILFDMVMSDDGKRKVREQVRNNAFVVIDEGQALTAATERQGGAVVLTVLRSAYTSETLGQANASQDTRRIVAGGEYVYGVVANFQPGKLGPLLADVDAGTPQRFTYASATDPGMTGLEQATDWVWAPPSEGEMHAARALDGSITIRVHADIVNVMRADRLAIGQGTLVPDPWTAHRNLVRLKTAALLAALSGNLTVGPDDWRLAGVLVDTSDVVLSRARMAVQADARARDEVVVRRAVNTSRAIASDAEDRVAHKLVRCVERAGGVVNRQTLNRALNSHDRSVVEIGDAIDRAIDLGLLEAVEGGWKCR